MARQPDGPCGAAAAAELWLTNRAGPPPKPVLPCRFTDTRPLLDGDLNESCWQVAPVKLQNAAGDTSKEFPTEARLSYDKDFLYISLTCAHLGRTLRSAGEAVQCATPTCGHDRISVMLDLDRDYCTYYHLQIDQRGCVCEDCWGDQKWDPHWFVAVHSEPTCWVVEAAIPLVALTSDTISSGKAWACNVVRVVPGRGVQAWSLPAEVARGNAAAGRHGLAVVLAGGCATGDRTASER